MTSILDLPPSVRQEIFSNALLDSTTPTLNLLPSCRQIYREARPILYKRPLVCKSQDHLWQWLDQVDHEGHTLVETLYLNVVDVPIEFNGCSGCKPLLPTWEDYQAVADRIHQACRKLPNVINYGVRYDFSTRTLLQQDFIQLILSRTPRQWPRLQQISFDGSTHNLSFLKAMPELYKVSASGFSASTPMETTAILSRLRHLKELELKWCNADVREDETKGVGGLGSTQSITRDTIKGFRGLQSLHIIERKDDPAEEAIYMNSGFIQALDSSHRSTMRTFEMDLNFSPVPEAQLTLHGFLSLSFLKHIDLVWPGFNEQVLDFLPETLVSLRIPPCPPKIEPYCLLELSINKCRLPAFCYISVARSRDLDSDAIFATIQFQDAIVELERCGVKVHVEAPKELAPAPPQPH